MKTLSGSVLLIIDGNNIVFNNKKQAILNRLSELIDEIQSIGRYLVVVSHELKYRIDDWKKLEKFLSTDEFVETPKGEDSDRYILECARKLNGHIVSNDQYRQYKGQYTDEINRRLSFMFITLETETRVILPWKNDFQEKTSAICS